MTPENWVLSALAGFVTGWIANAMTRSRFSFLINLMVGVFGGILLNILVTTMELFEDTFWRTLGISIVGAGGLLVIFHMTRAVERIRIRKQLQ